MREKSTGRTLHVTLDEAVENEILSAQDDWMTLFFFTDTTFTYYNTIFTFYILQNTILYRYDKNDYI